MIDLFNEDTVVTQNICQQAYFAKRALLPNGWEHNVRFIVKSGHIHSIVTNSDKQPSDIFLSGPVLPTLANLHSHAFQRVMAGAAEVSLNPNDSFWSWRDLMYKIVRRLTPYEVKVIATQLYIDMLKAGYSQVGEFHYLHHDANGNRYQHPAEMAMQLLQAADDSGIGLTLLPALYSYAGFGQQAPNAGQARFIHSSDTYLSLHQSCEQAISNNIRHQIGICFHSLRAVNKEQIETVLASLDSRLPIHIHISEQHKEVQDCLNWSGLRPVQWLHNEIGLNKRWCLVHATHLDQSELKAIASSHAIAGLCPTTEANLGDGIFPAVEYENVKGRWGIGSDSHVSLSVVEELRTLEYSQRLRDQQRNRLHQPAQSHIGDHLYQQALFGGNQACDVSLGLSVGCRADFMVLDNQHPFIAASESKDILNRWLFACNENLIKDVFVAGDQVVNDFHHICEERSREAFTQVIKKVIYS